MIRLEGIKKTYSTGVSELQVLKGINMLVERGEFVSIMGSSGSGKSTLLNVLGLLDEHDTGEYRLADQAMENLSARQAAHYRNRLIGFVFQSFNLLSFKTAAENVALPLYYQKVDRKVRHHKALEYLDRVGLLDWADHLPTQLSGGQQQRVAIARSLITRPKVILADEPTGALDSKTSRDVMALFDEVHQEGMTIILVTHEQDIAARTQRTIKLRDGLIEESATSKPGIHD